jgi:PAS domain S-box-containing protein
MNEAFSRSLVASIGLVVGLLVLNAALTYHNVHRLDEDARWVAHTHAVLDALEEVVSTLKDAETGQQGFLLAGDARYLQLYNSAVATIRQKIQQVAELTIDNADQQARIPAMRQHIAAKLDELQRSLRARKLQGSEAAQREVLTGRGQAEMDAVRGLVREMRVREQDLLKEREQRTRHSYNIAVFTGLLSALLGLGLVGVLVDVVRRHLSARRRAAAVLYEQRELFRTTLASIGDAVITTDTQGQVTFLNGVARSLTGWTPEQAVGQPLLCVFNIVNEETRQPAQDPASRSLRDGTVVGLANHTVLISRDGTERPIDDSAAPIRSESGQIAGVVLVFRDVTERRRLERLQRDLRGQLEQQVEERTAQLRTSEERFRLLVEGTRDYAIFMLDPDGNVVSWNPGAARIKGYMAEEIIGRHFSRFNVPEDVEKGKPAKALEVAAAEGRYEEEGWRVRKDGSHFWASVVITALRDEAGRLRGFSKITRDMTERKQAEESARLLLQEQAARQAAEEGQHQLRDSEEQFRRAIVDAPIPILMHAEDGEVLQVSKAWSLLSGYAPQDVTTFDDWLARAYGARAAEVKADVQRMFQAREGTYDKEYTITTRTGEKREWHVTASAPGRLRDGRRFLVAMATDVTDRKRAERTARFLADASAALAALVDDRSTLQKLARLAVPFFADWCAVHVVGEDGAPHRLAVAHVDPSKVELVREMYRRLGLDGQVPRSVSRILRTGQPEIVPEITDALLAETAKDEGQLRVLRELGLRSYIGVPVRARDKVVGVITFVAAESGRHYDATDLSVAEDLAGRAGIAIESARLYGELREADRLKDEFLAMLSHELRNPLTPIRNALYVMRQPHVDAAVQGRVRDMAERQVQHMARLLDDLLDVSRISRGKIDLRTEAVDLAALARRAAEAARPLVEERRHEITLEVGQAPVWVEADPTRLEQVISNLVNNSTKYTDPGGHIRLAVERDSTEAVVRVRDTGIGIAPDMLPRVFDLFVQAERRLDRSQGGVGIGLTLVRRLVELHGGRVEAHSEGLGKGSEFVVRLPALAAGRATGADGTADGGEVPTPARPRRVLVVDDNEDAAESLATLLRLEGQEVRVAFSGAAAIEVAKEFLPQLVFLDIGMPGMDGYEVAHRLMELPQLAGTVLVAQTGWGQDDDRRRSQEAGFAQHLVKPTDPVTLRSLLVSLDQVTA